MVSAIPMAHAGFTLQNMPIEALQLPGLDLEIVERSTDSAKFDLMLSVVEVQGALRCSCQYNTDLFETATIARWLASFETLVMAVVADADRPIGALTVVSAPDHAAIVAWNATARAYPPAASVHALFEAQAAIQPEAVAIVGLAGEVWRYGRLEARANQWAQALRGWGVRPERIVGVCLSRTPELIAVLLGVLKAGGAYLPLDPSYPAERLRYMVADGGAAVVVTEAARAALVTTGGARVVTLESVGATLTAQPPTPVVSGVTPGHLAYVIYTSGSTGQPNGVALTHGNAVALLQWAQETFAAACASVLAATSICFDLSVFELFLPLTSGGQVVLVRDMLALTEGPPPAPVTLVSAVSSDMVELVRRGALPATVVTLALVGEASGPDVVRALAPPGSTRRIADLYGPTEATTYAMCAWRDPTGPATIGRPIANTQVWVLDTALQPVPIGAVGELWIGGASLARGYLGRPALTAERFVPDPWSGQAGARLYRTGDRGRYRADGQLEFLGRVDAQVKVRGYRIEPGEIEAHLRAHPTVGEAAVVLRPVAGEPALVAYVTPAIGASVVPATLRAFLGARVPAHLLPAWIVPLDTLPRTPSGKIDRRALPAPDPKEASPVSNDLPPPRPDLEATIANIWCDVLGRDQVGRQQPFFEIGGHSLLLAQVHERLQRDLARDIPFITLFKHPTVAALAGVLGGPVTGGARS
jgi:amino acid adenylation domain-containing protein